MEYNIIPEMIGLATALPSVSGLAVSLPELFAIGAATLLLGLIAYDEIKLSSTADLVAANSY